MQASWGTIVILEQVNQCLRQGKTFDTVRPNTKDNYHETTEEFKALNTLFQLEHSWDKEKIQKLQS